MNSPARSHLFRTTVLFAGVSILGAACAPDRTATLYLEEDLVIGVGSDLQLGNIRDVAVDSHGVIYILDWGFETTWKLSPGGEYLGEIGRWGEGPGEMRRPLAITCGPDDKVYFGGQSKIIVVTPDGAPVDQEIPRQFPEGWLLSLAATADGVYTVAVDIYGQKVVHRYAHTGAYVHSFCDTYAVGHDVDTRAEQRYAGGYLRADDEGRLWFAQNSPQLVRVFDAEGGLLLTQQARNSQSPMPPEPKPLESGRMRYDMPIRSMGFVLMNENRYLLTLFFPPADSTQDYTHLVDLYDSDGERLAACVRTDAFWVRAADSQDRIYAIEEREDVPVVVRYRIRIGV